jgi:SAM-dependent methyltransferase
MNTVEKSWDKNWEVVFSSQAWGRYPTLGVIKFVASNFYKLDRKYIRILEVGCGTGSNVWYIAREGFKTYGIDGSPTAIDIASNRMKEELNDTSMVSLTVGDIINLPFEDNFFDAVIDVECLYANTLDNSRKIINEINRVLKKDGLFYSLTFSDTMSIGKSQSTLGPNEYNNISDGPLSGKGFVRLIDRLGIQDLYGNQFQILTIDKFEHTIGNNTDLISEWSIVCQKL